MMTRAPEGRPSAREMLGHEWIQMGSAGEARATVAASPRSSDSLGASSEEAAAAVLGAPAAKRADDAAERLLSGLLAGAPPAPWPCGELPVTAP
jgi:hypothetical protein